MKQVLRITLIFIYLTFLSSNSLFAQVQGKFGNTQSLLDVNAALEVESTSKGVLLPRLTTAQQNAMSAPTNGMLIYNTDSACFVLRRAGVWRSLCAANGGEAWSTLGNVGTNANTHFLGTTDNVPLSIRVNNLRSGYIDPSATQSTFFGYRAGLNNNPASGSGNTAMGSQSLVANTSGVSNTAVGANALNANVTGGANTVLGFNGLRNATAAAYNVAIGENVMSNATGGEYNTVVGTSAMNNNTTGSNNTALGLFTLQSNTTGQYNVAVGSHTLIGNTTGGNNIGMGHYTLRNNTIGENNVGIGRGALEGATTANNNVALGFFAMGGASTTGNANVGIGEYAMFRNTTGFDNVGIGRTALSYNNTGQNNIGIGTGAVYANTTGNNNVGMGANALNAAVTASNNTVIGTGAAQYTTSPNNTAFGYNALNLNTSGMNNVAVGHSAGITNTTGNHNTFLGYNANVSGGAFTNATAIGYNATVGASNSLVLGSNVNVGINTTTPQYKLDIDAQTGSSGNPLRLLGLNAGATSDSIVSSNSGILRRLSIPQVIANAWNILGNAGTVDGTNFIGTTDNVPLSMRVNNQRSGYLSSNVTLLGYQAGLSNTNLNSTFVGTEAGYANTTGDYNSAFGKSALRSNTTGGFNTAIAHTALLNNTTGSYNVAVGTSSLLYNTTGAENTAVGVYALSNNTTGNSNTAMGLNSLNFNTTGLHNTSLGRNALYSNTTGGYNTGLGSNALGAQTTGSNNTATGYASGNWNQTGSRNATFGYYAGYGVTSNNHSDNSYFGYEAGSLTTTGSNNVAVGSRAFPVMGAGANSIGIGYEAGVVNSGNNQVFIGYRSGTTNTTGTNNTLLGYQTNVASNNLTNATAIGANATVGASNSLVLGSNVNVGINTTTPQYKLDIDAQTGSSGNPLRLQGLQAGATSDSIISSNAGVLRRLSVNQVLGNAWNILGNSGTSASTNFIGTTDAVDFVTRTNNAERMRVTSSGNVGIGTTTPSDRLHVVGDFRIIGSGGGYFKSWGETDIEYDGGADGLMTFRNNAIGGSTRFLGENTPSSIEIMRLKNDGTVGIGNGSPQYKLDVDARAGASGNPLRLSGLNAGATSDSIVSSASGVLRRLSINQILGNAWQLGGNSVSANQNLGTTTNFPLPIITNNAERMRITEGGLVGIGTTTPGNLLTVSGVASSLSSGTLASFSASTTATSANQVALQGGLSVNPSGATIPLSMAGVFGTIDAGGSNLTNLSLKAVHGEAYYTGTNTVGQMIGVTGNIQHVSTGTITDAMGIMALTAIKSGGGTITNNYGVFVGNQTVGTNNFGIYVQGAATRALHVNSGISYFGGNVGVGITTPNQQLEITAAMRMPATTTSTTGVIYKGTNRFMHDYKPAANFGNNTFLGENAGNFTMTSTTNWLASGNTGVGTNALRAITEGGYNSALGLGALTANTTGSYNAGFGANALAANTTGTGNTAVGNAALQLNTTANSNTAIGNGALSKNTTGAANAAVGESALQNNTTGYFNTAVGQSSLLFNVGGYQNTAVGLSAMQSNTSGIDNIAIGVSALYANTTTNGNIAIGNSALSTTISSGNIAIGLSSGTGTTTGSNNTFLGYQTGITNTTGGSNTLLGYQADVTINSLTNATAIGNGATVNASNKIRLGNTAITNVETYGSFTTISDKRLKTNINSSFIGLDFIKAIRPVQYELTSQKGILYDGFVAQEVDSVLTKLNIKSFSGVSKPQNTEGGYYTVSYATFVVPLVNAVKELDALSEKLKVNGDKLAAENAALKAELERIKKDNASLKASVDKNSQDIEAIKAALSKKQN